MLDTPTYFLIGLYKRHRMALAPKLAELGLQPGGELMLAELSREDGVSQALLAERLIVSPPNVTNVLHTLERQDLVQRLQDPDDARVSRVYLTTSGRRLAHAVARAWGDIDRHTMSPLSAAEVATLDRLLRKAVGAHPSLRSSRGSMKFTRRG